MATEKDWTNNSEEIFIAEVGQEEYDRRLKLQKQVFQKCAEKGTFLDTLAIGFKTLRSKVAFKLATSATGKRATHPEGIGAQGFARVVGRVPLPENDFFTPGRLFEVRARHANFPFDDDTKLGGRSLSIKFTDHDEESPFDLICHTGPVCPFYNADSFFDMVNGFRSGTEGSKKHLLALPYNLDSHIRGTRRMPDSYYHQHYYAQTVYELRGKDGRHRLARFRIMPSDGSSESGRLTKEQQKDCWNIDSPLGTSNAKNYLKEEFAERIRKANVDYTLQVQIHELTGGILYDHEIYNPGMEWTAVDHPWRNLAKIILTTLLPKDVTEVTCFNICNRPRDVLGFKEPMTQYDFNIIPHLRCEVYSSASSGRPSEPKEFEGAAVDYLVTVVTGKKKHSGTDADVSVSIIGSKSRTSFRKLDFTFRDDFERASSRLYKVKDKDVGEILCLKVHKKPTGGKDDWYLSHITVSTASNGNEKRTHTFPCYRWLTNDITKVTLREGAAVLPQSENHPYLKLQRELEVQEKQRMYQWRGKGMDPGLEKFPGYMAAGADSDALPRDARFDDEKCLEMEYTRTIGKTNAFLGTIRSHVGDLLKVFKDEDVIQEKKLLLTSVLNRSEILYHIMENWDKDEEFGRQYLQGVNPTKIVRIDELPENFPVANDMVEDSLETGKSLLEEIQGGKVYLVTYPELEEYTTPYTDQTRFLCAPMCLLYLRDGQLKPIAIQLTQTPAQNTPIFTPKDNKGKYSDWLIAKLWVRVADCNFHQLGTHLLQTHIVIEPIAIAMLRNLPSMHPLYKLLIPHLQYVMAINTLGRKVLIPHGTAISQSLAIAESPYLMHVDFMAKQYEKFTFPVFDIPKDFEARGVDDAKKLPGYFYRDDALVLWNAIMDFVTSIVNVYYKTDDELEADSDLANMMEDLKTNGYHKNVRLRPSFRRREDLVHFLTSVVFCCSCQHAAVNFGQLDQYGFTLNAPTCLMQPPATSKKPKGLDDVGMKALLPPHKTSQVTIGVVNLLSLFSDTEIYLGDYPDKHFTETEPQAAIRRFQSCLKDISAAIHRRNESQQCPYVYLLPERIPNSIAI